VRSLQIKGTTLKDLAIVLVFLSTFDLYVSHLLLSTGEIYEANWWLDALCDRLGYTNALLLVKTTTSLIMASLYNKIQSHMKIRLILVGAIAVYTSLMMWHIYLIGCVCS
jgi:hypothetical protein